MSIPYTPPVAPTYIATTILILIIWPIVLLLVRRRNIPDDEWKISRRQVQAITWLTAAGFCAILFFAFSEKDIIGYCEYDDGWGWMDPVVKKYEAVYMGEYAACNFLFLFPVGAAVIQMIRLKQPGRKYFRIAFMRRYPIIIFISYISFGVVTLVTELNMERKRITHDQYVPPRNL
jgi:hypothetical protein